jgi:hypothetical protein
MQLDTFMLADAATGAPDGKLYIHGGGITRIAAPEIPWTQPQLAIVTRLLMAPEDWGQTHRLQVLLLAPDRTPLMPTANVEIPAPSQLPAAEGQEQYMQLTLGFASPTFLEEGLYTVELHVNDELLRSMPLPVVLLPDAQS